MINNISELNKSDILFYGKTENSLVDDFIDFFQFGKINQVKAEHDSFFAGDHLLNIMQKFLKNPNDYRLRRILNFTDGLFTNGFTIEDVKKILDTRYDEIKYSIFESHIKSGCCLKPLNQKWLPIITRGKYKSPLSKYDSDLLISKFESKLGYPYNLSSFLSVYFRSTIGQTLGLIGITDGRPIFHNERALICSQYVSTCFYDAHKILSKKIHPLNMSPTDVKYAENILLY